MDLATLERGTPFVTAFRGVRETSLWFFMKARVQVSLLMGVRPSFGQWWIWHTVEQACAYVLRRVDVLRGPHTAQRPCCTWWRGN